MCGYGAFSGRSRHQLEFKPGLDSGFGPIEKHGDYEQRIVGVQGRM